MITSPAGTPFDGIWLTQTSGQIIPLTGISNNLCTFHYELVGADPAIFTVVQPVLAPTYPYNIMIDG